MLTMSDFNEAYASKPNNVEPIPCKAALRQATRLSS